MGMRTHVATANEVAVEYRDHAGLEEYDSELNDFPDAGLIIEDAGNCEAMVLRGTPDDVRRFAEAILAALPGAAND